MIITIFGATGQVGKRVVSAALNKGYTVRSFGRNIEKLIDQYPNHKNLVLLKGYVFLIQSPEMALGSTSWCFVLKQRKSERISSTLNSAE